MDCMERFLDDFEKDIEIIDYFIHVVLNQKHQPKKKEFLEMKNRYSFEEILRVIKRFDQHDLIISFLKRLVNFSSDACLELYRLYPNQIEYLEKVFNMKNDPLSFQASYELYKIHCHLKPLKSFRYLAYAAKGRYEPACLDFGTLLVLKHKSERNQKIGVEILMKCENKIQAREILIKYYEKKNDFQKVIYFLATILWEYVIKSLRNIHEYMNIEMKKTKAKDVFIQVVHKMVKDITSFNICSNLFRCNNIEDDVDYQTEIENMEMKIIQDFPIQGGKNSPIIEKLNRVYLVKFTYLEKMLEIVKKMKILLENSTV